MPADVLRSVRDRRFHSTAAYIRRNNVTADVSADPRAVTFQHSALSFGRHLPLNARLVLRVVTLEAALPEYSKPDPES
jgi:hypothetical protein